jgi:hypothetical protein
MADNVKKTDEQRAAEYALAIMKDADAKHKEAVAKEKENKELAEQIKALQDKIKNNNRAIGRSRRYVKYHAQEQLFDEVVDLLDLKKELEDCKTPSEFDALVAQICDKLRSAFPKKSEGEKEPVVN